jgi:hypothetical protein
MQVSHLLGAGILLAGLGFLFVPGGPAGHPAEPPAAPPASGHCVLVVEGDRDRLAITHAVRKPDPWAGVPQGFASDWTLAIRDAGDRVLAEVPVDVSKFETGALQKGQALRVEGCIVKDARIAMLVNVPWFETAATYEFARAGDAGGRVAIGSVPAATVQRLAGGGR